MGIFLRDCANGGTDLPLYCCWGALNNDGPDSVVRVEGTNSYGDKAGNTEKRVRLFCCFDVHERESLNEFQRFVLASIRWHGTLTLQQVLRSLNTWMWQCVIAFNEYEETVLRNGHKGPR